MQSFSKQKDASPTDMPSSFNKVKGVYLKESFVHNQKTKILESLKKNERDNKSLGSSGASNSSSNSESRDECDDEENVIPFHYQYNREDNDFLKEKKF